MSSNRSCRTAFSSFPRAPARIFGYLDVPINDVMNGWSGWAAPYTANVVWGDPECVPKH